MRARVDSRGSLLTLFTTRSSAKRLKGSRFVLSRAFWEVCPFSQTSIVAYSAFLHLQVDSHNAPLVSPPPIPDSRGSCYQTALIPIFLHPLLITPSFLPALIGLTGHLPTFTSLLFFSFSLLHRNLTLYFTFCYICKILQIHRNMGMSHHLSLSLLVYFNEKMFKYQLEETPFCQKRLSLLLPEMINWNFYLGRIQIPVSAHRWTFRSASKMSKAKAKVSEICCSSLRTMRVFPHIFTLDFMHHQS